ncbi:MAG: hypothetical protein Q7U28_09190 [Aquabacterium sp.]|nr:hypothetical protein [Aquabacterium sp.]
MEQIIREFPDSVQAALKSVLSKCQGANPDLSAATAYDPDDAKDATIVQSAMRLMGRDLTFGEAFELWNLVALDSQQTSVEAHDDEGVLIDVQRLCEHVRDGCDYAGISKPLR